MENPIPEVLQGKICLVVSGLGAVVSITSIQPYLTASASIVSILAGLMACVYYYKKSK